MKVLTSDLLPGDMIRGTDIVLEKPTLLDLPALHGLKKDGSPVCEVYEVKVLRVGVRTPDSRIEEVTHAGSKAEFEVSSRGNPVA